MNLYWKQPIFRCLFSASRNFAAAVDTKTADGVLNPRVKMFEEERNRQLSMIKYTEKITVKHVGAPESCELIMNKHYSTPFNCAQHIQELLTKRSVLALVNGMPWSMHRPLEGDCELQFLHFKQDDPKFANECFWRSCAFVLRYVLETSFSTQHSVRTIVSERAASFASGSFVVDTDFGASLKDWNADERELRALSVVAQRLHYAAHRFEPLSVRIDIARRIFADCPLRTAYLDSRSSLRPNSESSSDLAAEQGKPETLPNVETDRVLVYRMGDYVDLDDGVLMNNTSQLGLFSVTAIHRLSATKSPEHASGNSLRRVQGVALPTAFLTHHATFEWLARRAARLNRDLPLPAGTKPLKSESKS